MPELAIGSSTLDEEIRELGRSISQFDKEILAMQNAWLEDDEPFQILSQNSIQTTADDECNSLGTAPTVVSKFRRSEPLSVMQHARYADSSIGGSAYDGHKLHR